MMDGAQGADKATEDPAQENGQEEHDKRPPDSFDDMVP
jgi:hypothetical protein